MYNVNNKFALKQGGWNTCDADTELKDHTMREIARPNNDTHDSQSSPTKEYETVAQWSNEQLFHKPESMTPFI